MIPSHTSVRAAMVVAGLLLLGLLGSPAAAEETVKTVNALAAAEALAAIQVATRGGGENCALALVPGGLQVTAAKGAEWASLLLPVAWFADASKAKELLLEAETNDAANLELRLELWDGASIDHATRSTLYGTALAPGRQTLRWDIARCVRNRTAGTTWDLVDEADRIDLAHLTKIKLFLVPPKDRDYVVRLSALRLVLKTPTEIAADAAAAAGGSTRTIFRSDFENGKGLGGEGVPFKGNWRGLCDHEKPVLEAPKGAGNAARLACTVHAQSGKDSAIELPLHHTEIEPRGWDATVTVRVYNGGFQRFRIHYSPIFPNDTTFCNAAFEAPVGKWTEVTLPFDKFLFQGRRPRRGTEAEYFCITASGPTDDDSFFQFDDFTISRTRRTDLPEPKPKPPLPAGVLYRQAFDDPADFDVDSYCTLSKSCNVFRVAGGLGADGREEDPAKDKDVGCLRIEAYEREGRCCGARRGFALAGADAVVEFDCRLTGIRGFGLSVRGEGGRYSWTPKTPPEDGKWTHLTVPLAEFTPEKVREDSNILELDFTARGDGSPENYILIDNLMVSKAAGETQRP